MDGAINIAAVLPRMAQQQPDTVAIHYPIGRGADGRRTYRSWSYRQLDDASSRIARGLEKIGIGRGVRTVLMVPPSLEFFALSFGMFKAGVVPVVVDPGIGIKNLGVCLAEAAPQAFVGIAKAHVARLLFGWGRASIETLVTVGRRWLWGGSTLEDVKRLAGDDAGWTMASTTTDEVAAILFTSGSTGVPKGVVYTHGNFMAQVEAIREMYDIRPGEVDLPTFPMFGLFDPAMGMTTVIPDMDFTRPAGVDPTMIEDAVRTFGVTTMFGSPALLDTVGRYGATHGTRLPGLKRVISAGAAVPSAVMRKMAAMLDDDAEVVTPYGATESLPVATISSRVVLPETAANTDTGAGTCVGHPVRQTEVCIIRIDDGPIAGFSPELRVPIGEIGEICVKGPVVTRTYFNRERSTALAKMPDPEGGFWHRMGDLGYLDARGRIWFCGRKSHRVITADAELYSEPCEAVFNVHPAVKRTALTGVPAGPSQQRPVVCVELEPECPGAAHAAVLAALREIAGAHEHTRGIDTFLIHPGFPVDIRHNAKIDRTALGHWAKGRL
jgi:olefin beta-lactone synthetase